MVSPHEPFVAEDGLVYEDLAARILGEPDKSWRNAQVLKHRAKGTPEEVVREWITRYDGCETPRTAAQEVADSRAARAAGKRDPRIANANRAAWGLAINYS